jgi:hypothetical protein
MSGPNGRAAGAPSSLVLYRQTVAPPKGDDAGVSPDPEGCSRMSGWLVMSQSTGAVFPARCGRLACAYCVRVNARRRALAISYARPEREITFTAVGDSWPVVRDRVKRVAYGIRKEVGTSEWVWHVEQNPKGTGHHVHAWQKGSYVPQRLLTELAVREGMGRVTHVSKLRNRRKAAGYGLKGLSYGMKGIEADREGEQYLGLNGQRLTHQSRGFFVSTNGDKLGVRGAEKAAMATDDAGKDPGPWVLIRSG